jgi:hypothetical protein
VRRYGYDDKGRLTSRTGTQTSGGLVFRDTRFYTYDSKNRIATETATLTSGEPPVPTFHADTAYTYPNKSTVITTSQLDIDADGDVDQTFTRTRTID